MIDIAPELYEQIRLIFNRKMSAARSGRHKSLFDAVENGKPTYQQAEEYARIAGSYMSSALQQTLTVDVLPDGKLYYNIAQKTLGQALLDDYDLVAKAAEAAQQAINDAAGVGIKPILPGFNQERVDGLVDLLSSAELITDESWVLGEPIVNFHQNIVDESIRQNAEFHDGAGLQVTVTRRYDGVGLRKKGVPCEWCLAREGSFTYSDALASGVFQRHEGCGCIIDYTSKKGVITRSTSRRSGWT